jgi:hypothetical protein
MIGLGEKLECVLMNCCRIIEVVGKEGNGGKKA